MSPPIQEENFLSVLKQYQHIVYKICNAYCRNPEDRKDLAQEITVQLWRSLGRYNDQYSMSTFIYRIALNVAISFYRSKKRTRIAGLIDEQIIAFADNTEPDDTTENNLRLLYQFIHQLDELNKALMLLYLDDNSYKEIASILGITETNVATKINRIKQKLKLQFNTI